MIRGIGATSGGVPWVVKPASRLARVGTYEYSAVTTSLSLTVQNLWLSMAGRGLRHGPLPSGLPNAEPTLPC